MKQLELLFGDAKEKEVQLRKRLANTLKPNPAYGEVTNRVKPGGRSCWAATKVKELSPEIIIVSEADTVHFVEGNMLSTAIGKGVSTLAGSKTAARQQMDSVGTRETQSIPCVLGVCDSKPINGKLLQKILWESDQSIVVRKSQKRDGAKGLAVMFREGRDTSSALRGGLRKSTKLSSLFVKARENPKLKFTSLAHMLSVDFLRKCFGELKKDRASGVDGVTVKEYGENLEENLKDLVKRLKTKQYRPKPVRRVYIPKPKGGKRPLGIPSVEDKIVQMGLKNILEAIFEVDFLPISFGFRPNRNCHQALDVVDKAVMTKPVNCVVDMDIEKFFDTVDHKQLMKLLRLRIVDPNIFKANRAFLKSRGNRGR